MKKLLLTTAIFLSMGLMASAQVKKTVAPAPSTTNGTQKKTIKDLKAERTAKKIEVARARKANAASRKPVADTQAN